MRVLIATATLLAAASLAFAATSPHGLPGSKGKYSQGPYAGCQYFIVCVINGQIVNGPGQEACNNGKVETIRQCQKK